MFFIILGVLVWAVAHFIKKNIQQLYYISRPAKMAAYGLIILGVITGCIIQVDAGYVGVQKLFGKISDRTLSSGLHLINPLVQVTEVDIRTTNYTMSGSNDEDAKSDDDAIKVLTADGLAVVIDLTVLYKVIPSEAPKILREIGANYEFKIIRPVTRTEIRDNAVFYDAIALYSTKRDEFQTKIFNSINEEFKNRGLMLENLLVRNITLPESVRLTIEQKINAEQEAQKMQFVLQKEKQEAERKRVEAQGITDYQNIINTSLTDRQLQYEQIKAIKDLAASPNAKIVLMGKGNGAPIILDAK